MVENDESLLKSILPLTDVMGTGHHAAVSAGVRAGGTVAVVGDGAVGLCGVLAAKRLGAGRIIMLGRHEGRLKLSRQFGATDFVKSRGDGAIQEVQSLTGGVAESVLECVGTEESMKTAIGVARPGGAVGYVGVSAGSAGVDLGRLFRQNIRLVGGVAPVRAYIPELLADVLAGKLDPSPVLDLTMDLPAFPKATLRWIGGRPRRSWCVPKPALALLAFRAGGQFFHCGPLVTPVVSLSNPHAGQPTLLLPESHAARRDF